MKIPLCRSLMVFAAMSSLAHADTAFFTKDAASVIFQPLRDTGKLWKLDIASGRVTPISLGNTLKDAEVVEIAQGADGEIMALAGAAIWLVSDEMKKITDTADAERFFRGPSEGPVKDWLFVVKSEEGAERTYFARKPGTKAFQKLFVRRVNQAGTGTFTSDGRFLFAGDGDLWEGGFEPAEDADDPNMATLIGCRIAPLAAFSTDMSNASSVWVDEIHIAGDTIFAGIRGRHQGSIVRLPLPAKPAYAPNVGDEAPSVAASLELMKHNLAKAEVIVPETGGLSAMAATVSNNKPLVFYRGEGDEKGIGLWLWSGAGEPKRVANEPGE